MKKIFLFITVLIANFAANAQQINSAKLDSLFDLLEKNNKAIGSVALSKGGEIIYKRSIGFSTIKESKPVPANDKTLYRIGSTTKMYTAAMIFQLVDEGKLSLDTKVSKFYPKVPNADKMTIEMLLNHTNGLYDFVNDGEETWITKPRTKQEMLDKICDNAPHFAPGESEAYSNSAYLIASYIIEDVTGKSYNQNLQKRICKKLKLKNTYSPADNVLKKNEASSFLYNEGWEEITDIYFPNVVGVGDILATPTDVITFTEALISGKLFSSKCLSVLMNIRPSTIGTGIFQFPFYDRKGYGHTGGTFGTSTIAATFPDGNVTISYCINGGNYNTNDIAIAMLSAAYNRKYNLPVFTPPVKVPTDVLNLYTGTYSSPEIGSKLTITRDKSALYAQGTGETPMLLEATSTNIFTYADAGLILEFNAEKKQLILKQGGGEFLMSKE